MYRQVNDLWVLTGRYLGVKCQTVETLRTYLNSLTPDEQGEYARRCGTSIGYLRKALSKKQRLGEQLTIALERESTGAVRCEDILPDVDWEYLRLRPPADEARTGTS